MADPKRAALREELKADVALMRELGVARWGEIYLGPPPAAQLDAMSPEERARHIAAAEERAREQQHKVLFAASGMRPKLPRRPVEVEGVVQRSRPPEHDDGTRKPA